MAGDLAERWQRLRATIPAGVGLVAVTKYSEVPTLREAYHLGMAHFGENRIQEAQQKQEALRDLPITWHLIGHLQSNKVPLAVRHFAWIHSVDRPSLIPPLQRAIAAVGSSPKLLLQVKLEPDPDKSGWQEADLLAHLDTLRAADGLNWVGLMTMLPLGYTGDRAYEAFLRVKRLQERLWEQGWSQLQELSMGMSADYPEAIRAGATLVRIGSQLFRE
ncbi:MAG: YggS family pyridoxal phosphate-dependent enzyme [Oscillatoriales cyanobacterium SM2_2_1]|nr:YggS family pyridoxal phosphate-dependent enzyme [Oscillatoriales cyanobacterium SM2_2_1]